MIDSSQTILLVGAGLMLIAGTVFVFASLSPAPKWVSSELGAPTISAVDTHKDKKVGPALITLAVVLMITLIIVLIFMLFFSLPLLFSLVMGLGATMLILPMINDARKAKRQEAGRKDAMHLMQYVVGRLNARSSLYAALSSAAQKHNEGTMLLPVIGDDLFELVKSMEFSDRFASNLIAMSYRFFDIDEVSSMFKNLSLIEQSELGADAKMLQAKDAANELVKIDAVKTELHVELTASRGTRFVMMILMLGLIVYLAVVFRDGPIGTALVETVAGNIAVGLAMFSLVAAQLISSRIERMPLIRF